MKDLMFDFEMTVLVNAVENCLRRRGYTVYNTSGVKRRFFPDLIAEKDGELYSVMVYTQISENGPDYDKTREKELVKHAKMFASKPMVAYIKVKRSS